jgi:hypothetical protein
MPSRFSKHVERLALVLRAVVQQPRAPRLSARSRWRSSSSTVGSLALQQGRSGPLRDRLAVGLGDVPDVRRLHADELRTD